MIQFIVEVLVAEYLILFTKELIKELKKKGR